MLGFRGYEVKGYLNKVNSLLLYSKENISQQLFLLYDDLF